MDIIWGVVWDGRGKWRRNVSGEERRKNQFVKTPTRWWCVLKIDVLSGIGFWYDVCGVNIQYPRRRCGMRRCVDELVLMFVLWEKIHLGQIENSQVFGRARNVFWCFGHVLKVC